MLNTAAKPDDTVWLHVVAAVIRAPGGQVLLAKRPSHKHQGDKWEFPGGKVETDEQPLSALQRELYEELGIDVAESACRPLIKVRYRYPDKAVLLDVWEVQSYQGEAFGKEGQSIAFFSPDELSDLDFPAANRPIVTAARLPDTWLITPELDDPDVFLVRLERALSSGVPDGVRLVQLRVKQLDAQLWGDVAPQVLALVHRYGAQLVLNSPVEWLSDADGLHLTSTQLRTMQQRPDYLKGKWLSASCHNAEELRLAEQLGVDFVLLSPVHATSSHPAALPLGWQAFATAVDTVNVPVFALGGMQPDDVLRARQMGGQGIAAISALWDVGAVKR